MKKLLLIIGVATLVGSNAMVLPQAKAFDANIKLVQDAVNTLSTVTTKAVETKAAPVVSAAAKCNKIDQYIPSTVDMTKLRNTWLKWNNDLRTQAGLDPYVLNTELDWSALNWSDRAKRLGSISHKRDGSTAYYDYNKILAWFKNLGLTFKNVHRETMTENIGWGVYKCPADGSDCTPAMTKAIKTTLDFFVREKASNGAHWRSMMDKNFTEIGLGLALDKVKHKYYMTIHYATAITSSPVPICKP